MYQSIQLKQQVFIVGLIACTLALTLLVYWPSLSGPFLFDDIPNLEPIGRHGGLTTAENFWLFITTNGSGPLGRPLSMLTFAINDQHWPADSHPFRYTNLFIHLFCGLLVFIFCRQLFGLKFLPTTTVWLALICMALWLLHPLLVSTTAYIVQRMTQLSSLFMLCGLICYLRGRSRLMDSPMGAWAWILGGMGLFGSLAILSKENGILLPLYALIVELTLFANSSKPVRQRKLLIAVLVAPVIAAIAYLFIPPPNLTSAPAGRAFTLGERWLTQSTVLVNYLKLSVLPQMSSLGVFQDDYPLSRGLLDPPNTIISLLILSGLLGAAAALRRRLTFFSLGIFWFFAGHSLEAGPISLELYFEHRNYLPLLGLIIAVVGSWHAFTLKLQHASALALLGFIGLSSFTTWQAASLWGDKDLLTYVTAMEHPDSVRAQQSLVNFYIGQGDLDQALELQVKLNERHPRHGNTLLGRLYLECSTGNFSSEAFERARNGIQQAGFDTQIPYTLNKLMHQAISQRCEGFSLDDSLTLFDAAIQNQEAMRRKDYRGAIEYFRAHAFKQQMRMGRAIQSLETAYENSGDIEVRFTQVAWLVELGEVDSAQYYLDLAKKHEEKQPWLNTLNRKKLDRMQHQLDAIRKIVESRQTTTPSSPGNNLE